MSTIAEKQRSREILSKEVGFPMANTTKKIMKGNFRRISLVLPETLSDRFSEYLESNPDLDQTKSIRTAIAEYLDRRMPSEPRQRKAV